MEKTHMLLIGLMTITSFSTSTPGVMPTDEGLRTAESEHFIYVYQESLEPILPALIRECEDAHELLTPIFRWRPREKTIVLFSDAYDVHNGWATVYPRPTMMIFAGDTPPGSTIYEPGNYIRRTVFHEYTHLLSMDPQYGFDGALSRIFGRVWPVVGDPLSTAIALLALPPGAVAPTWFIEGLAMWTETEMVGPGRGRSTLVDMVLRMSVAEDRVLTPLQWELDHPEWPYGDAAYLYGLKTIQYAHERYGLADPERNVVGELSHSAADSFIFFFNNRALAVTGERFSQMTYKAIEYERARQRERIRLLEQRPFTETPRLTPRHLGVYHPNFGGHGDDARHIFFSGDAEAARSTLYRYDTQTDTLTALRRARTSGLYTHLAPNPDRTLIYYTRLDSPRREKLLSELYAYDVSRNRARRVSREGRYRFPAVSPDGTRLAAVRAEAGRQILLEIPIDRAGDRASERVLVQGPPATTLVDPAWSPDGQYVVYVSADEASSRLRRYDRETGTDEILVNWPHIITSPAFHPNGRELVFVSDRNGVYNLYRMRIDDVGRASPRPRAVEDNDVPAQTSSPTAQGRGGRQEAEDPDTPLPGRDPRSGGRVEAERSMSSGTGPEPLTHVLGGVFDPDFSPDGRRLTATAYDSYGYYLTIFDYEALQPPDGPLPEIPVEWNPLSENETRRRSVEARDRPDPEVESRPYNSARHVRLDFWSPWLDASRDGVEGGLVVSLSDPVGYQSLTLIGGYESEHRTPLAAAVYEYSGLEPFITFYGSHNQVHYDDLVQTTEPAFHDYDEEVGALGATLTWPWERADRTVHLTLGYQWTRSRAIRASVREFEGEDLLLPAPLFDGNETAVWSQLEYFDATAYRRSHSLEDGRYLSAIYERTDEALGGDLTRNRALGSWNEYIPMPWGDNHVLKLEGHYGRGSGDETAQGFFGIGGFGDIVATTTPGMPRNLSLRGYDENTQVGREIVKAGAAYRFPIWRHYRGADPTTPMYYHQLFGELFYEGGRAFGGELEGIRNNWLNAAGIELNVGLTLFRFVDIAPGVGVVYAADREARDPDDDENKWQVYVSFKGGVNF